MKRSASEILKNLETRIARLENKIASTSTVEISLYMKRHHKVEETKVKCKLTKKGIVDCIKKEFGMDIEPYPVSTVRLQYGNILLIDLVDAPGAKDVMWVRPWDESRPLHIHHIYIELPDDSSKWKELKEELHPWRW